MKVLKLNRLKIQVDFFNLRRIYSLIQYLVFLNIQSQSIDTPVDEPLTTDTTSNNEITPNEQNHSILSFSEHDTSQSHASEKLINDDRRLELNAQILVDDSIQNAQEKYQKVYK